MGKIKVKELESKFKLIGIAKEDNPLEESESEGPDFSETFSPLMISQSPSQGPTLPSGGPQSLEDIPEIKEPRENTEEEIKGQTYVATSQNIERERRRYQQRQSAQIQPGMQSPRQISPQQEQFQVRPEPGMLSNSLEEDMEKRYDINNPEARKQERRKLPWEV